jgi:hypothetical protein
MRLLCILSNGHSTPNVKHYVGFPPDLTKGEDTRQLMGPADFLIIAESPSGVFLYRFNAEAKCVGDTWHMNIEDAKHQAIYEYESLVQGWTEIPAEVEDAAYFGLEQMRNKG